MLQQLGLSTDGVVPAVVLTQSTAANAASLLQEAVGSVSIREHGFLASPVLPHVLTLGVLTLSAALVMHVQVATRLLCTAPATYWYAAHLTGMRPRLGRLIWAVCLAYAAVGTVLHVNFYPWT